MKKKIIAFMLACSSVFAFDLGVVTLDTELGGIFNYTQLNAEVSGEGKFKNTEHLTYGAYGRIWLGVVGFMIAPQVKWDYLDTNLEISGAKKDFKLQNMQYGGLIGYRIPVVNITPYVGVSYSDFISGDIAGSKLKNTYAINFGAMWKIPFLPLSIGFDGSYQKPKFQNPTGGAKDIEILTLGGTVGLIF